MRLGSIKQQLTRHNILVLLIPKNKYAEYLETIVGLIGTKSLCYVSLNRPLDSLPFLKNNKKSDLIVIDAVSTGFSKKEFTVFPVSSPRALTQINIAINKAVKKGTTKVVFDSLSTFLVYEDSATVIKFSHSVITDVRSSKTKCLFIALKEDTETELVKDLSMFVDKVIEL